MRKPFKQIIFILLTFLTIFTIYLSISELSGSTVCLVGNSEDASNCNTVQNSEYGRFLGIKMTYLGTVGIILLAASFYLSISKNKYHKNFREIYLLGTIIGGLGAIYFLSIQFFVLKTICSSCLVVDLTMLTISILTWIEKAKSSNFQNN